jgi:hypothetical protein
MSDDRFLLIKAWSYILWADVEHVLSQLLIAEITGRIPVIYWPTHCLHNGFVQTNGFELYFEPVSPYTIFDTAKPEYTYYPPVWDCDSLLADDQDKETWIYRNIGDILNSNANVVVGDVYFDIYNLISFIKKDHTAYGMTVHQINRYLFQKYIRIKQDIKLEIQGFYNSWLKNETPVLAVHISKVDKSKILDLKNSHKKENSYQTKSYLKIQKNKIEKPIKEYSIRKNRKLLEANKIYHEEIKKYIEKYNIKKIFLLTNCEEILKEYQLKYGSMLVSTQCKRIGIGEGSSYMESAMVKRRRGIEVIKDAYLASQCEFFIGNDFSCVTHAVTYITDWPDNNVKILYWKFKNRKYPINMQLIAKREGNKTLKRIISWFKKLFKKD